MTLEEERRIRLNDLRRQTYVGFLDGAETALLTRRTDKGNPDDRADLQRALGAVILEGPMDVAQPARELATLLDAGRALDEPGRRPLKSRRTRRLDVWLGA